LSPFISLGVGIRGVPLRKGKREGKKGRGRRERKEGKEEGCGSSFDSL